MIFDSTRSISVRSRGRFVEDVRRDSIVELMCDEEHC